MNRPVELFPLLNSIDSTEFGSFEEYANRYCKPKQKMFPTRYGKPRYVTDYSGADNLDELSRRLETYMLRRYKHDVLSQLPPKFRSFMCLTPDDSDGDVVDNERQMLKDVLREYMMGQYNADNNDKSTGIAALQKLEDNIEEFSSNAGKLMTYIGSNAKNGDELLARISKVRQGTAKAKLKPSIELLEEYILEEKVVVFAHHRVVIDALLDHFGKRAVGIMGGMEREDRDAAVKKFQNNDSVRLFVGSIRAAGVGLTLTASSHVIFLELDWSPGVMTQAEDRCHRVGQLDSVRVQYFVFRDTIDEWLSKSLLYKQNTINNILPEKQGGVETGYVFNFGKHGKLCSWIFGVELEVASTDLMNKCIFSSFVCFK